VEWQRPAVEMATAVVGVVMTVDAAANVSMPSGAVNPPIPVVINKKNQTQC